MGSQLFLRFLQKRVRDLKKQGPPGSPPRPGLIWKPQTHRWIRPSRPSSKSEKGVDIHRIADSVDKTLHNIGRWGATWIWEDVPTESEIFDLLLNDVTAPIANPGKNTWGYSDEGKWSANPKKLDPERMEIAKKYLREVLSDPHRSSIIKHHTSKAGWRGWDP